MLSIREGGHFTIFSVVLTTHLARADSTKGRIWCFNFYNRNVQAPLYLFRVIAYVSPGLFFVWVEDVTGRVWGSKDGAPRTRFERTLALTVSCMDGLWSPWSLEIVSTMRSAVQ